MNDLFDKNRAEPRRADPRVIAIRGAREHNLKNIDVDITRDRLVVMTDWAWSYFTHQRFARLILDLAPSSGPGSTGPGRST